VTIELATVQPLSPSGAVAAPRALLDYDFPSILSTPPRQRVILWLLLGVIAAVVIWLSIARIDVVVSANGRMISSDSQIVIQPLETSVVRHVAVKPGDKVKAGTVLATLDPTFTSADEAELISGLDRAQATLERLQAERAGLPYDPAAPNPEQQIERQIFMQRQAEIAAKQVASERKIAGYNADLAAHKTEAQGLAEQIYFADQKRQIYAKMAAQTLTSKIELLDAQQRLAEVKSQLQTNLGEQQKLQEQIAEASSEWDALIQEWQRKLSEQQSETLNERNATAARLSKAKLRRELSVLRAPTDGTVLDVADRPAGSVMREAETLMSLVPAGAPLLAEVEVDPRDVGRLQVGDEVTLKLEALPWQQFGLAHGIARSISPDVLADDNQSANATSGNSLEPKADQRSNPLHYRVRISVTDANFRNPPEGFMLRPGMRLTGDIKVGRRSILEYLLNPITRVVDESLKEP
jgi:HlyD family secretion protein